MKRSRKLPNHWVHCNRKWLLVAALFCLTFPLRLSQACGPVFYEFSGYSFLDPGILVGDRQYESYFASFPAFYQKLTPPDSVQIRGNLEEWQERFCNDVELVDLEEVIYNTRLNDLRVLRTAVRSKKINLPSRLFKNAFARHLKKHQCSEVVDYLIFAKSCEPHVLAGDLWNPQPKDTVSMQRLIEEGKKEFNQTKSEYVRLRYAYQIVRLAHYSKNYRQTLALYDYLEPKLDNDPSIIEDWMLGHKAGALMSLGENVEASYLFSLIFNRCPTKRESAYQSFKIESDEEWHQCQLLCGDDPERATLHALRAHSVDSRAVEEMEAIYKLDPQNKHLEPLLVREIGKLEKDLLGLEFNDRKKFNASYFNIPRKQAKLYLAELLDLVRKCNEEGKVSRPELWKVAEGYLEMMNDNLFGAEKIFETLESQLEEEPMLEQLKALQLALRVNMIETMSYENEDMVYDIITENPLYIKFRNFPDYINDRMAFVYRNDGHPGMAFRCEYTMDELKPHPQLEILDDLIAFSERDTLNLLERALLINKDGENIHNELLDIKGTMLMSEGKLEAAKEVFRQIPLAERNKYQFNPFEESFIDCVHCPLQDSLRFNKVEIIDRLFELEYQGKSDMVNGARNFYEMGVAYYNMSYFGNSWMVTDYFRSGANWDYDKDDNFSHWAYPYGNKENRDLSLAMFYFEKARSLTKDENLAAKAAFMAARCEQKNYFMSEGCDYQPWPDFAPDLPESYSHYYNLLIRQYSDTEFYQQIIQECKFFEAYARK